ncbi:hypothetical protein KAS08_00175 [Candidatus Pacearchaeota archaeon]|nr:hypothetical protein [Candidatus Pacearchaeota archaeon]
MEEEKGKEILDDESDEEIEEEDKGKKLDDDFFIGKTKLTISPNFKPVRKSLEKMVTKEMFEEAFPEKFERDDEEEEEVYVPATDEEAYNEVREDENIFEDVSGTDFYAEKNKGIYSEDNARKDKYAPVNVFGKPGDDKVERVSVFNPELSEEIRKSRKSSTTLN